MHGRTGVKLNAPPSFFEWRRRWGVVGSVGEGIKYFTELQSCFQKLTIHDYLMQTDFHITGTFKIEKYANLPIYK